MNANRISTFVTPIPSAFSRMLSRRVKRLEFLRYDACAHRDRLRIALIDRLIKDTILEWCDSFIFDMDTARGERLAASH